MSVAQNLKHLAWARYHAQNFQVLLATSLRRVPLAWARDHVAQTSPGSPRREPRIRAQRETLQFSLRRGGPAWARFASFSSLITHPLRQNHTKILTKRYQHNVMEKNIRTSIISN